MPVVPGEVAPNGHRVRAGEVEVQCAHRSEWGLHVLHGFGGMMLLVGLGSGTMLFSRLAWAVRELERRTLEYLRDSHLPVDKCVVLYLHGCEKSCGRLVFSTGVTGCNTNRDEVGSC
jgi:hypothetical protein